MLIQSNAPTPFRRTVLELDPDEVLIAVPEHRATYSAAEIAPVPVPGGPSSEHVTLLPGGAWSISPHAGGEITWTKIHDKAVFNLDTDFDAAEGMTSLFMFRRGTDRTDSGIETDPLEDAAVVEQGLPAFVKHVEAGASWLSELASDALAFAAPLIGRQFEPLDRVLAGKQSLNEGEGFYLSFTVPPDLAGTTEFLCFYFGGEASTTPEESHGGTFCLRFKADGTAQLKELDGASLLGENWKDRYV